MKSKEWLISLGLAVVLVVAFALPSCTGEPTEYWYSPEDEKIEFTLTTTGAYQAMGLQVATDLQDFGLDVDFEVIDSSTFWEYIYEPNLPGGLQAFIAEEGPSPDPLSDWIWEMLADPESWGYLWNPCWYDSTEYDDLMVQNYLSKNLTEKQGILFDLQELVATDIPMVYLVRGDNLGACRIDRWDNWYGTVGGYVSWLNEYSIRDVTPTEANTDHQLRIAVEVLQGSLDMDVENLQYSDAGALYLSMSYENLAAYPRFDEQSAYDFVPELALNYTVSYESDGTGGQNQIWTINLREDVKWHDHNITGETLDADDVIYTIQYITSRNTPNKPVNWTAAEAGGGEVLPQHMLVTKTGQYQVQLRYIEDYHQNEDFIPCVYLWDPVVPKHKFEGQDPFEYDGDYVGTGPFKVKEFVAGEYLLLERFDDYWGPLPEAEEVLLRLFEASGPMWLAFEAGEIDNVAATSIPFAKVDSYEADPDIGFEVLPGLEIYYLGFNLHPTAGYEHLQDLALREAIAAAINKQNIVDLVLGGYGEIADCWIYSESENKHPDLPNTDYDLTLAESILTSAGYTKHA